LEEPAENSQKSILINPNLGHPTFLQIDRKLKTKEFQIQLLFVSNDLDLEKFKKSILKTITFVPLFDYKWSLKEVIKKKGFFARWREKRALKKREKKEKIKIKKPSIQEQVRELKSQLHRGQSLQSKILKVEVAPITPIHHIEYLDEINPQDYLVKHRVFGLLKNFYKVNIEFTLSKEILKFLKERNFIMFDINCLNGRINYHSLVISKQDWKDFTFVHATDLHLAERNDQIYGIVKNWAKSSIKGGVEDFFSFIMKKLKFKKKSDQKKEELLSEIKIPLRKRLINPNNQFRRFIKLMNRKVLKNELDLIVFTGDLVDFTILSKLAKKIRKLNIFRYNDSNWQILKNIILNTSTKDKFKGVIRGEELHCPFVMTLGNHDYRPFHYDLTWGEMYKKIGLNASEAIALNELFSASPITAITKTPLAVKGYLSEINPFFDFSMMLGNNLFIVLNSGSDSFKNFRDLISGHPSVTGVSFKQIKYLENLINNKITQDTNIFLFLHGPPLNTSSKKYSIKLFEKKGERFTTKKLIDFKESLIKKQGQPPSAARIDTVFNVKYGGVSTNWEKLMDFCKNYCILTLAGHTHDQKEFRLENPETKTSVYVAPPFSLKQVENPAAVFYDDYSEIYTNAKDIEKNGPFVVQTPALGLGSYKNPETAGAYREIHIKEGKLDSFRIKYINR